MFSYPFERVTNLSIQHYLCNQIYIYIQLKAVQLTKTVGQRRALQLNYTFNHISHSIFIGYKCLE